MGDPKLYLEKRDVVLDGFQVQYFRVRVNDRLEFDPWKPLQGELNRLITLHFGRIDVHIRRELDFGNQTDPATGYDTAIGLCECEPDMGCFDVLSHIRARLSQVF